MPVHLNCKSCNKEYSVIPCKKDTSKFCSKKCKWEHHGWSSEANTTCTNCGKNFHMKPSQKKRYERKQGYFCSNECLGRYREQCYRGEKNPNFRDRTTDRDGFVLVKSWVDCSNRFSEVRERKLHRAVCCEVLGVKKIKGLFVHHRDANDQNNTPENLVVLNGSDHRWIHKNFGNATLWAYMNGKVSEDELVSWCRDKKRARRLLGLSVLNQKASDIGAVVDGELRESDRGTRGINDSDLRLR